MGLILLQKLGFKQHTRSDDMPQGASSTEDASLSHMAPDLDNVVPPTPIRNLLNWRRGVNSTRVKDSPTPVGDGPPIVDFSQFTFPPKSKDHWIDLEDAEISRVIRSQVTATQDTLPKSDLLMTLGYVSRTSAQLDSMIIRPGDVVVDGLREPNQKGFMFYDELATTLRGVIEKRGVYVDLNDEVMKSHSFYAKHGVRVFREVTTDVGPRFKYMGDYFIHRTTKTLKRQDWELLSEQVKRNIVMRYVNASVTGPDDPCPGSMYTPSNVRKWYDAGGILPLVKFQPTGRPLSEPTGRAVSVGNTKVSSTIPLQATSFMNMDDLSESLSEEHTLAAFDFEDEESAFDQGVEYTGTAGSILPNTYDEDEAVPNSGTSDLAEYHDDDTTFVNRHMYTAKALMAIIGSDDDLYKVISQRLLDLSDRHTKLGWENSRILNALHAISFGDCHAEPSNSSEVEIGNVEEEHLKANNDSDGSGRTERVAYPLASDPNPPPGYF